MKEYITTEVPAFGKLLAAIQELTQAGVIKWRNHVDSDSATLRLTFTDGLRSLKYNCEAICIEVGGHYKRAGRETDMPLPNHDLFVVAGAEAEQLNNLTAAQPVDTEETDLAALLNARREL